LLWLPASVYLVSYAYLAFYHGRLNLLDTPVHEGGLYTFLQTLLYASHFLGHIPVHTALALYFVGVYLCLSPRPAGADIVRSRWPLIFLLANFLLACAAISLIAFGIDDTMAFILQQKQSARHFGLGGSWNLHLPSTLLQLALIPVFIFAVKNLFAAGIQESRQGFFYAAAGLAVMAVFTWLVNKDTAFAVGRALSDPRHLAHSVREIATFPLTYYPLPLFAFLAWEERSALAPGRARGGVKILMGVLVLVFAGAFLYQAAAALSHDIGALSQKPAFMKGESLGIAYLLASHYFEHFLDTIYFSLACLILYVFAADGGGISTSGRI
jgi:hypothetical protein